MSKSWVTICVLILLPLLVPFEVFANGQTTRVSVSSAGVQGNEFSVGPSISSDGRYVAFESAADNLVAGDTNELFDVFVHDRKTGQTTRVSVSSTGTQGGGYGPSISPDGQYVAFESDADNLVAGDTNKYTDIFLHYRQTGETTRVSVSSAGEQGNKYSFHPSISSNGRYVTFQSYANNIVAGDINGYPDIFVHDRQLGQTTLVSVSSAGVQGNGGSYNPSISSDGQLVAFQSAADNLVASDSNSYDDIFVHDRQTGQTTLVSVSSTGLLGNGISQSPSISPDGQYVAFQSDADNLVAGDTNGKYDVFVHDRQTGQTSLVSLSSAGVQGNSDSYGSSISSHGRYVAFDSYANNLVDNDDGDYSDIFVHDRQTGQTTLVSVSSDGVQGNYFSFDPSISSDGQYLAYNSQSDNLVAGDSNDSPDIFIYDRLSESFGYHNV
jgi:Tol biopolymer transport system component